MAKADRKTVAAKLGVTTQRLGQLIRAGRITEEADGIDVERAVVEYERNTDRAKRDAARLRQHLRVVRAERPETAHDSRISMPVAADVAAGGGGDEVAAYLFDFNKAKARKEHYNAERSRIETEKQLGNLISRDEVRAKTFNAARIARDRLLGLPPRLANYVPAEHMKVVTDEVESVIRDLEAAMSQV